MRGKVLIIDDDPDILKGLKDRAELLGFCPLTAESGEKGLGLLEKNTPSLFLLDLALPEMTGLDVLREIIKLQGEPRMENPKTGQNAKWSSLPVIVLTAHGTLDNAIQAMKLGAYDFLTKPFEMDHLTLVIEKALERESLKKQVEQLRAEVDAPFDTIIYWPGATDSRIVASRQASS